MHRRVRSASGKEPAKVRFLDRLGHFAQSSLKNCDSSFPLSGGPRSANPNDQINKVQIESILSIFFVNFNLTVPKCRYRYSVNARRLDQQKCQRNLPLFDCLIS